MYYEINIAKLNEKDNKYYHYFATAERSISTEEQLKNVHSDLKKAFPKPMYEITIMCWKKVGYDINPSKLK